MKGPILSKQTCKRWIKALRSGKFEQGRNRLRSGNQHGTKFCCLGVLHEISDYPASAGKLDLLPGTGLNADRMGTLAKLNDRGQDFAKLADRIERYTLPHCPEKKVDKKMVF
jgi:hypothetical protein